MSRTFALLTALLIAGSAYADPDWRLVWNDEFNGAAGLAPDSTKWTYDTGAGGWGNGELQKYTTERTNSQLDGNGNLVITARRTADGEYTSARLNTRGEFTVTYGKIEGRMKIPRGQGIWPAFWMLGANAKKVGWPECGEIDIMENIGREAAMVHATVHGPGYSGAQPITEAFTLPDDAPFADEFHIFSVIWTADSMEFFVDSHSYLKVTRESLPAGAKWVFNKPYHLLLNLAVGGSWPGNPESTTEFPQDFVVDYVRVYQR